MDQRIMDEAYLLRLLCAEAFARGKEMIPSTREEIEAYKANCQVTEVERRHFEDNIPRLVDMLLSVLQSGEKPPVKTIFQHLKGRCLEGGEMRYAARNAKADELSPELRAKVDQITTKTSPPQSTEENEEGGEAI